MVPAAAAAMAEGYRKVGLAIAVGRLVGSKGFPFL